MNPFELSTDIPALHKIIQRQTEFIASCQSQIKHLTAENKLKDEMIEYYKNELYNKKSEKFSNVEQNQALLFNEVQKLSEEIEKEIYIDIKGHKKRKKRNRGKREGLDPNLPRTEKIIDLEESEKICGCGCNLSLLPYSEISEKLVIIPAQYLVERYIRLLYVCRNCEGSGDESRPGVKAKPPVPQLIPKAILHRYSIAYMIVQKYCDHIPLYRICAILKRSGVNISRATLANNFITVAEKIESIANAILDILKSSPAMQIDETRLQVIKELGRKGTDLSWMWCFRAGLVGTDPLTAVFFHYDESRSAKFLKEFLCGYKGVIQTDGLNTYDTHLSSIIGIGQHAGCNVHARRYFKNIHKSVKNNATVNHVLKEYSIIYRLEKTYERLKISKCKENLERRRQKYSLPIMLRLKTYIMNAALILEPAGRVYKACKYFTNQYDKLVKFIYCGDITPDTNWVENAIRPFAVGRKNWLFCFSPRGARASAIYYTLVENAKICGLNPYDYFVMIFDEIVNNPNYNPADLTPQAIAKKIASTQPLAA